MSKLIDLRRTGLRLCFPGSQRFAAGCRFHLANKASIDRRGTDREDEVDSRVAPRGFSPYGRIRGKWDLPQGRHETIGGVPLEIGRFHWFWYFQRLLKTMIALKIAGRSTPGCQRLPWRE